MTMKETAITSKELVLASTEKSDSDSGGQTPSPAPSVGEKKARAKGGMKGPILLCVLPLSPSIHAFIIINAQPLLCFSLF